MFVWGQSLALLGNGRSSVPSDNGGSTPVVRHGTYKNSVTTHDRPNSRNVFWSLILDEKTCHVKLEEKSWLH
jgi:hypothetical protein